MLNHLLDVAPSPSLPNVSDSVRGLPDGAVAAMLVVGVVMLVAVVAVFAFVLGKKSK